MKHAALLAVLQLAFAACGGAVVSPPAVSVGSSPTEVAASAHRASAEADREPVRSAAADVAVRTPEPARAGDHGASPEEHALFLTDGEGHRFSVETIRTNSPASTR